MDCPAGGHALIRNDPDWLHRWILKGDATMNTPFKHSLSLAIMILITTIWTLAAQAQIQPKAAGLSPSISVSEKAGGPVDLSTAIIQTAKMNMPAVVYIEVTESRVVENPFWGLGKDPFFQRFFGTPKMPRKFKQEMKGLGSGIILDSQGHILTNNHVAGGATKMRVTLADGSQYPATLVGADPPTDLAVIKISPKESLPYVTFGDSEKVEVGEWVVAIGAPRALEKSVTQGIISAKHRAGIGDPGSYQDFLQTDAPINPGNSGGPLLNLQGEVVGVNAAIATESGGFEGIGFTIPSNIAVYVAKALIAHGKVERGWLGIRIRDLTPEIAQSLGLEASKGALVVDVVKGGPAEKAGLKKNDVVIVYRGKDIPDSSTFRNEVAATPIGQEAKITVLRGGKKEEFTVKIGSLEEGMKIMAAALEDRLGVEVRPVTPAEVEKYGLSANQGVVITRVDPKGPFGEAGFEVNDMILQVDDLPITGLDRFVRVMSALKPNQKISVVALDHRTGNVGTIMVAMGAERHFRKARTSFLENDSQGAASEIRKGAADLKSEADQTAGKGREILQASIQELEKLAEDVKQGTVDSVKKLDEAFARAYDALAPQH
jgi:serine protease Do